MPFPSLLACVLQFSGFPFPQDLPLVEIPPALLSRGCTGGWVGAAQGQRLAALARPQGPVPACANPPTRLNFVNLQNFNPFSAAVKINNLHRKNCTDRKGWKEHIFSVQTFDLLWWPCEVVSTFALTCCPLPPIAMNATANRITCIQLGWDEKGVRYTQSIWYKVNDTKQQKINKIHKIYNVFPFMTKRFTIFGWP